MRRAVVTDTTAGAEECLDRCQNQGHPTPPLSLTLLRSHDALGSRGHRLQRRVREPQSHKLVLWSTWSRNTQDVKTERSPTTKLGNQWNGDGEHLRAEQLRTGQEEEEPWTHGSDRPVLWRRQKETEQGEQQHLLWVSGCRAPSCRPGSGRPGSCRSGSGRPGSWNQQGSPPQGTGQTGTSCCFP